MSTKNRSHLKIFTLSDETTKVCWWLGHCLNLTNTFNQFLEFFTTSHADVKKYLKYTCRSLGVSCWLRSSCFYSRGI